jgi:hypothetical protein
LAVGPLRCSSVGAPVPNGRCGYRVFTHLRIVVVIVCRKRRRRRRRRGGKER